MISSSFVFFGGSVRNGGTTKLLKVTILDLCRFVTPSSTLRDFLETRECLI